MDPETPDPEPTDPHRAPPSYLLLVALVSFAGAGVIGIKYWVTYQEPWGWDQGLGLGLPLAFGVLMLLVAAVRWRR